jgi:hypothetical protein
VTAVKEKAAVGLLPDKLHTDFMAMGYILSGGMKGPQVQDATVTAETIRASLEMYG